MLTERQVKIILILLDDKGHAEWELANDLEMVDSNLNPILKKMERMGIIYQGEARTSGKQQKRKGDYREFPYYLSNNVDGLRIMIKEIAQTHKILDTGFILETVIGSKYIKSMKKTVEKDLPKIIADELRNSYPPYAEPRFIGLQRLFKKYGLPLPFLEANLERHFDAFIMPSDLELWYYGYLHRRSRTKLSSSKEV
jgi:predicted transcriptional regulator